MFTNKREIFSFRKYKAYGLASAVIAAFFLAGGVAHADEVTATTTPTVTQVAPSEASTATNTEASTISAGETAPTVTTTAPAGTAVTSTETPVDGATYASDTAKQAVKDHLAPLAQSTTPAPTAAQIYKEDPAIAAKLTADDKVVEAESKEAFDKLPDAVRRRVKSVTIEKQENGNLGHTASISGNVTLNAQYFHNDGKDGETEVLYHEIGHAIDGATYKRNADGSDYSLSRDAAVQPLIRKVYPGQVNYEGWASMFGTYMLQKTGQREIKTDLDREINQYFTALMVGFTEPDTKLQGEFVNVKTGDLDVTVSTRSADRTVVATSADNGVKQLNNLTPHGLDITVSGKGALTENSYIDVTVETNLPVNDINKDEILTDTFKGTSYAPTQGDYKKSTQTARISLAGLTNGTQKEYVIQANEFHKDAPVMSNLQRIVTYKVYIDGTLQATKVLTDTLIPTEPLIDGKTSETQYVRTRGESVDARYLLTSDDSVIRVNSKRPYGVYEVTVPDDVKMTLGQDESLESYRAGNKYVLPQNVIDAKKIRFNTSVAARKALDANPDQKRLDQTIAVSYYYSDKKFEDVSTAKKIEMSRPLVTLLSDVIPGEGRIDLGISIEKPRVFVLSTSSDNIVKGTLKNGTTSSPKKAVAVNDTILTLNMDEKPLNENSKFILQPMRTDQGSTVAREFRDSTMKVSVVDADTGVKIGVAEAYKALDIPKTTKRLKLHVETNEKLGYLADSSLSELNYSVTFKSNAKDAMSWKKDMDHQNSNLTETRFKFDLLDDQGGAIVNKETKLSIFNDKAVVNVGESTYVVFTPTSVQKDLFLPILTSKALRDDLFPLAALEYVKADDSNNIIQSRVFYTGPIEDESRRPAAGSYVDTVYDGSPGVYSGIWFKSELPAGTNVYEIPVHLKMKDPIYALNDKGGLVNGESHGYLRVLTYDAKSRVTLSTISYKSQHGKKVVVDDQSKEVTLSSYVYNMTDNSVTDLSAMAYIPKSNVDGSTADAKLVRKIDAPSGWKVLYTTNDISGNYSKDRNLAFSESVEDYTKVTALKFVADKQIAPQSGQRFDVPVLTKMTRATDTMSYRTVLLTNDREVLSEPVVATPNPKSLITKITIKHVLDPNDEMTNKFRNMMVELGDLQDYDLQRTGVLKQPVARNITAGSTESISKLSSKTIYEPFDISAFGDGLNFEYTRVTAETTEDLKAQLNSETLNVDKDTTIEGTGVTGSEATITYYYKVQTGKLVERFVNEEGTEIAPTKESAESIAYGELVKTGHPDTIETERSTYEYASTDAPKVYTSRIYNQKFGVVEGTTTVTYVYRKVVDKITYGSVIATYKDTEGNELAPQENVKTNVPDAEAYTTAAKTIQSSEVVEKTPEGLTKRTTTTYELTETPDNATGTVTGGQTTTVPYVYRKNVTVQTYGSVIATYKDEEGHELTSPEKVITNQPGGTYYEAAPKDIQGSAHATVTPEGRMVTITTYKLIKTPDNEHGDVVDGEIIEVPYVYRKNVEERMVPGNTPTVEIPELKVTQYQTEAGVDVKASDQGFVDAPNVVGNYQFTGTTNTNEAGDVQTHIYKLIETEVPNEAPSVDVPALNVTRYVNEEGTEIKDAETGLVPAPSMIGDTYEFTGRTETTEDGTVQTHVYKVVEHEVPNDAPKRLPEELQITRFVTEDGKDIAPIESGIVGERPVIGDYQYTGRSTHEDGIHTHYYNLIEHEVPNDAPSVEIPALNVTRYVNEEGTEIKDAETGLVSAPSMIGNTYEFTGRTETTDDGTVQTHVYKVVEHQVPGDAPQVDVPKLLVTRFVNETGDEIESATEGFVDARPQIGDYEFTGKTKLNDGQDVQTHVYRLSVHEVPNEAPVVEVPELQVTRHVDEFGNDLVKVEKGRQAPKPTIREYQYTDRTTEEHGITTHFYAPIKHEVPNEAPIVEVPELTITRHVNEKGDELLPIEKGSNGPRKTIGDYEYTGRTDVEGGITTHFYAPIKHEVPNEAPSVDVPELMITRHVDEFGNDLVKVEKGRQAPKPTIREYQYTDRTMEEHGITTHFYAPIKHEVPNDAPIVEIPELQITRYVDGDGHDLQDPKRGHHEPEPKLGDYEFTGRTTKKDGITTHYYQRIPHVNEPKREVPTKETPKDEPKREVPTVETPKDQPKREVPVVETPKAEVPVSDELPHTGDEVTSTGLALGIGLLGLFGLARRKREE